MTQQQPPGSGGGSGSSTPDDVARAKADADTAVALARREESIAVVEQTRARAGMWAVIIGDVVICVLAGVGLLLFRHDTASAQTMVAVLTSAFTAVGTLTTAYFGIKATANTAQRSIRQEH